MTGSIGTIDAQIACGPVVTRPVRKNASAESKIVLAEARHQLSAQWRTDDQPGSKDLNRTRIENDPNGTLLQIATSFLEFSQRNCQSIRAVPVRTRMGSNLAL